MAKRNVNHEKANFWRKQIAEQAARGGTIASFCRDHKLVYRQFYQWKRILLQREGDALFAPVRVTETISSSGTAAPSKPDDGIEIVTASGSVVKVRPGFDGATLIRVLKTLEAKPC
jgi:hypothetical protein